MLRGTGITVLTYQDASPRKRLIFCRGIYILLDETVGCLGGKSIGSQGIANDWVGGRCGALLLPFFLSISNFCGTLPPYRGEKLTKKQGYPDTPVFSPWFRARFFTYWLYFVAGLVEFMDFVSFAVHICSIFLLSAGGLFGEICD
jgi:hypothetical protein